MGYYLYSSENCLIDMTSFPFCYNLNKRVPDWDSTMGRTTSWVIIASGPLAWVTFVAPSHLKFYFHRRDEMNKTRSQLHMFSKK
jgi:hypothetical protein